MGTQERNQSSEKHSKRRAPGKALVVHPSDIASEGFCIRSSKRIGLLQRRFKYGKMYLLNINLRSKGLFIIWRTKNKLYPITKLDRKRSCNKPQQRGIENNKEIIDHG